ncbi:UDP-N-acetylglucosamine 2-epimerase [compost metagenome]
MLSDSGTLSEESAMLGFTGILLRTSTERPEVLDKGTVVIGGIGAVSTIQAIQLATAMNDNKEQTVLAIDYTDTNTSVKVVKIIQSYTEIINNVVWRKE